VSRRNLFWGAVIIEVVVTAGAGWKGFAAITVILGVLYLVSLQFNSRERHQRCAGSGERHGWLLRWRYHRCRRCAGTGRVYSPGAGQFGPPHVRREVADRRRTIEARQRTGWR